MVNDVKFAIIIALAFILLSSTIIPTMATHEPTYYEQNRMECKEKYEKNVYVEGHSTEAIENGYAFCLNLYPDPEKPFTENQCYKQYDDEIEKMNRAIEVGILSLNDKTEYDEIITQQLQECIAGSMTENEIKCHIDVSQLRYTEELVRNNIDEYGYFSGAHQDWYDDALAKYTHCIGIAPETQTSNEYSKYCKDENEIYEEAEYWFIDLAVYGRDSKKLGESVLKNTMDAAKVVRDDCSSQRLAYIDANSILYPTQEPEPQPVVNSDIVCGNGEIKNMMGQCVLENSSEPITNSDIVCGKGTVEKNGQCVVDTNYKSTSNTSSKGGGCLIATATYGSELAPQVQQLRELRDNQLLSTESGTNFMNTFNDVYYSFSPIIADYERENPVFKEMVKIAITPMITSLSLMEYAESESEVLGIGISLIMLNGLMYVGIPASVIVVIRRF